MISLSRRNFIRGSAAMPLALWLTSKGLRASEPLIRYDAASPMGQYMLAIYADAVAKMRARSEDDPLGWLWQWYTHFVKGATTKTDEILRIFGGVASERSALAGEMWNTCQSHAGQNVNHFLPWHRMFVLYFECIVREVSGVPEFTLPYWNYTSSDPLLRGVVPPAFRMPDDPRYASLYRPQRKSLANGGQPIHQGQPGDPMDISAAMAAVNYSNIGGVQGFNAAINNGIHGRIHIMVGTNMNMGKVSYAGNDPLFWVHHSNIDRLWASWNANGGVNPTTPAWTRQAFVFADAQGQRVSGMLRDYFDIGLLGYGYDALISPPGETEPQSQASLRMQPGSVLEVVGRVRSAAQLGAMPTRVLLSPDASARRTAVLGLDPGQRRKRTYLILKGLHTWSQPETLYHVYLTPTRGGRLDQASYAGNINFFDAEFHDHGDHDAMDTALGENFYSFDVTELLRRIDRSGNTQAREALQVTFVPGGVPRPGGKPIVASIELARQ